MSSIENGIREGLSFDEYLALPAISRSEIMSMGACPRKAKLIAEEGPQEQTAAMLYGSVLHAMLLEPSRVEELYAFEPAEFAGQRKQPGKTASSDRAVWREQQGSKTVVEYETAKALKAAERRFREGADENVRRIIDDCGSAETVIVWDDEVTGAKLKARIDCVSTNGRVLADLKTTSKTADLVTWKKTVFQYDYHAQAAMYLDGWKAVTGKLAMWAWIVQEKDRYGMSAAHVAGPETLEKGRSAYRRRLEILLQCRETGQWPGYVSGKVEPPKWYSDPLIESNLRAAPKEPF